MIISTSNTFLVLNMLLEAWLFISNSTSLNAFYITRMVLNGLHANGNQLCTCQYVYVYAYRQPVAMDTNAQLHRGDLTQTLHINSTLLLQSILLFHIIVLSQISLFKTKTFSMRWLVFSVITIMGLLNACPKGLSQYVFSCWNYLSINECKLLS